MLAVWKERLLWLSNKENQDLSNSTLMTEKDMFASDSRDWDWQHAARSLIK